MGRCAASADSTGERIPARTLIAVCDGWLEPSSHRGPDAQGIFVGDGVALGHRRLSILDLSCDRRAADASWGHDPCAQRRVLQLSRSARELESAGRVFRGHSDTEVILHAYDAWGLEGLARLEGIFAFALWDAARRRMVLMRDRLGVKPLYYAWINGRLAFGSEIKAVLAGEELDRSVDDQSLAEYLWYGNVFEDRTMYRAVRALEPGHRLVVEDGPQPD
jgi:asparagine synthase (glutamine-hydrolysing)